MAIDQDQHNTARFFVENRHVSWLLLIAVVIWGAYSYREMPKRKDPEIPVRVAVAVTPWPGQPAERIEALVTREVEAAVAESSEIQAPGATTYGIQSLTLPSVSIVKVQLDEHIENTERAFNDINLRLAALSEQLPKGAGPVLFSSGFGDTAAVLFTVASPPEGEVEVALRARDLKAAIERERQGAEGSRATLVVPLPRAVPTQTVERTLRTLADVLARQGFGTDYRPFSGGGFAALDMAVDASSEEILERVNHVALHELGLQRVHPDAWHPMVVQDPAGTTESLAAVAGDKYSYQQLDEYTELLSRALQSIPEVSKVRRAGVLPRSVYLDYSQEELAGYGLRPEQVSHALQARNTSVPGGILDLGESDVVITPSGQFTEASQLGDVVITHARDGSPVYLRELFEVREAYQSPARLLNYLNHRQDDGSWRRARAVSLGALIRDRQQIASFDTALTDLLDQVKTQLPEDLIIVRTSDQPRQVRENVNLFLTALYEAIALVVLVGLIGFREWRSATLLMLAIPITLAMTFGFAFTLGIEIQQVSVATLIIALGLLVDDPVVAGDAIRRELAAGSPRSLAAWLGPTKLARAIFFATVTNVAAYLPFLLLDGSSGNFVRSLPIVMACALIASRIVSMTFVPLLGYYLLRQPNRAEPTIEERRSKGFSGWYYRVAGYAIDHRGKVMLASLSILAAGFFVKGQLLQQTFPPDEQYLSYVDVWLPNDATLAATDAVVREAETIIREVVSDFARETAKDGEVPEVLDLIFSSVGAGPPRWWYTITPELEQSNYAQIILRMRDKLATPELVPRLQEQLSARIPGAWLDVRQLQISAIEYPVSVRISARASFADDDAEEEYATLRALAEEMGAIFRSAPGARRVRDDWGEPTLAVSLEIQDDRADLAGITHQDIALSSTAAVSGIPITTIEQGTQQIPVIARLRLSERAHLSDLENLYVYSGVRDSKIPLAEIATIERDLETRRIRRLEQFRTITVFAFPAEGVLASELYAGVAPQIETFAASLPSGYELEVTGEEASGNRSFSRLRVVMAISVAAIFLALVLQFNNAVKPLIVFASVPYGMVGGLLALYVTGTPFAFMAFLGLISLIGVIVSHVIVLFDFIETMHEQGEPLREALLDAGIVRLRPVLVTVGATVLALFPLALHGGPLWRPLCFAQIGGLTFATFVTLILVPVLYSIVVLDLKLVRWDGAERG